MILYTLVTRSTNRLTSAVLGALIVATGTYFLLRNAFGFYLPQIDWDLVWPVVLIVAGVTIVSRAVSPRSPSPSAPGPAPERPEPTPERPEPTRASGQV